MRHTLSLSILLMAFWLLMSGHFTLLITGLGVASVLLTMVLAHRMDIIDTETHPIHLLTRLPRYILWLLKDLVASNFAVILQIWRHPLALQPVLLTYQISECGDIGKVVFANSITITPGTISIDLKGDYITVHALTKRGLSNVKSGEKERMMRYLVK